jgi:hypothetical protein
MFCYMAFANLATTLPAIIAKRSIPLSSQASQARNRPNGREQHVIIFLKIRRRGQKLKILFLAKMG